MPGLCFIHTHIHRAVPGEQGVTWQGLGEIRLRFLESSHLRESIPEHYGVSIGMTYRLGAEGANSGL